MSNIGGIIGVSDHGGWAVLVTTASDGTLLDRRRVDLVDEHLPKIPHHHEAQSLPLDQAEALIGRVRVSAEKHAAVALDAVAEQAAVFLNDRSPALLDRIGPGQTVAGVLPFDVPVDARLNAATLGGGRSTPGVRVTLPDPS